MDELMSVIKKEQTALPINNAETTDTIETTDNAETIEVKPPDDAPNHDNDANTDDPDNDTPDNPTENITDKSTEDKYLNNNLANINSIDTVLRELIELSKDSGYNSILEKIYYYFKNNNIFQFQHALTFLLEKIPSFPPSDIIMDKINYLLPKIRYYIAFQQDLYVQKLINNNNLSSLETLITNNNKTISDNIDEYADEIVDNIDTVNRNFTENFTIITDNFNKNNQKIDQLLAKLNYSPVPVEDKTREAIVNIKQSIEDIYSKISSSNNVIVTYLSTIKDQLNKLPVDKSTDNIKDIQNILKEFSDKLENKIDNIHIKPPDIPNIPKDISKYIFMSAVPSLITLFIFLLLLIG